MNHKNLLAMAASFLVLAGCGQQAEDTGPEGDYAEYARTGMELPASTTSDEAREQYMAGWADLEVGRFNAANKHFASAGATDPAFAMAHMMTAWTSTSTEGFANNLTRAGENAAGATRGEQLLIESFQKGFAGDPAGQVAAQQELTALHPNSARAWLFLGNSHGNLNNTADERAAYRKAIEMEHSLVAAHVQLGNSYLFGDPKDYDQAEAHILQAIRLAPYEPFPHDMLGDVHRAQGNLQAAYDNYTKAAELAPEQGSPLQQRGHVNSFLGNYDEARADYTRSAELEDARGTNAGPFFLVFRAYVSLHEGNPDAAIAELREIAAGADASGMEGAADLKINALTNVVQIATQYGIAEAGKAGITDVAALMRQQADDIGTDQFRSAQEANISYLEGMLAARMGDTEGAAASAAAFETHVAANTNPNKLERMHEILGMSAYHQEDYAAAVEHLSAGDHLNNMSTKYFLALANDSAGNGDEAQRLLSELAVWNFNGPGYAMVRGDVLARVASD
ncbi:MAG: tetratricopeptide repeat protein [Proteobacteria bacterium]|nr:tetratricopeptide repeat protein [Pseudomonadota bacterium]